MSNIESQSKNDSKGTTAKVPPVMLFNLVNRFLYAMKRLQQKILPPNIQLINYAMECMAIPRCLYIVSELGIAELLKDGPKPIEYLAKKTKTNENILYRIMRLLSGEGIFKESQGKIFETTRIGKALEDRGVDSATPLIKWIGSDCIYGLWSNYMKTVENGKSHFKNKFKMNFFEWNEKHPKDQAAFNDCLQVFSAISDDFITAAYNFSSFKTLVDVAGGRGGQLISILRANPKLKGILFDLPFTIGIVETENIFENAGVSDRVKLVEGDFFQSVVPGGDAYFMKSILHDWDDEHSIKILTSCRKAMEKNSKLLIAELVVNDGNKPHFSRVLDVSLAALNEGMERNRNDYSILLEQAGFKLTRIVPTSSPYSIVEAKPV